MKAGRDGLGDPLCDLIEGTGLPQRVRNGVAVNGQPTLVLTYWPAWGTNFLDEHVAIIQRRDQGPKILWSHATDQHSAGPQGESADSTVFHWRIAPDRRSITVAGVHRQGFDAHGGWTRAAILPPERYCYRARAGRYVACS